jgi:NAD(P)-dependent dehydrogenase (short-subunit alcohol dehydrogenase family)
MVSTPETHPTTPKVVLITGAARRLGREMALACARAGWRVAVHYRSSEADAIETVAACAGNSPASGAIHSHHQADLGNEAAVRALLPRVAQAMGRVDAVVNNASVFELDQASSLSFASLDKHLHTNTAAAVLLAQALAEHLGARNAEGCVVNLLDQKLWNPNPDFFSYTLSKAALEAATSMLALALAPRVRVVGVAPGLTLTSHMLSDEKFQKLHAMSPLGRSSAPEDVAATVLFALQNRSITGTTLLVDGGQHLQRFERDFSLM